MAFTPDQDLCVMTVPCPSHRPSIAQGEDMRFVFVRGRMAALKYYCDNHTDRFFDFNALYRGSKEAREFLEGTSDRFFMLRVVKPEELI